MNEKRINLITAGLLILFAAASRLIPHPPNFTPVAAIALFSGVYLGNKKLALLIPVAAMLVGDAFIGFHSMMIWVYGSFILIGLAGLWLRSHKKILCIAGTILASSIAFFIITNFGVWAGGWYGYSFEGLVQCYVMAIPFFKNTFAGDVFYVTVMFSVYEAVNTVSRKYLIRNNLNRIN